MVYFIIRLYLLFLTLNDIETANILIIVPTPSISHNVIFHPIIKELSSRGHKIVSVTTEPLKDSNISNLTEINVREVSYNIFADNHRMAESRYQKISNFKMLENMADVLVNTCDVQLNHSDVQDLITNSKKYKFDLLIVEYLVYPVFYHFKQVFNTPMIGVVSLSLPLTQQDAIGGYIHPAFYVDTVQQSGRNLNFWQRLSNFLYLFQYRFFYHYFYLTMQENLAKKYFGNNNYTLMDLEKSVDLVLTNTNPIFNIPRAIVPCNIEIGGIHLKDRKILPKDLLMYLNNSPQGVIYFSLGSNVKSKTLPKEIRTMFLRVFSKLHYNILWKWENDTLENKPDNVFIQKWFPQQDILDHPNVKLFITQGGLQSIEEAIRSKVPMIVIPFNGDQPYNADRLFDLVVAIKLEFEELCDHVLLTAINKIIMNPKYLNSIHRLSKLWWDQPMTPLNKAIWWIEYVIRNNGSQFLQTPTANMPWYIYWMLDIIAFIFGAIMLMYIMGKRLLHTVISLKKNKKD